MSGGTWRKRQKPLIIRQLVEFMVMVGVGFSLQTISIIRRFQDTFNQGQVWLTYPTLLEVIRRRKIQTFLFWFSEWISSSRLKRNTGCDIFWVLKDRICGYICGYAENYVVNKRNNWNLLGYQFDPPHPKKKIHFCVLKILANRHFLRFFQLPLW